MRCEKFWDLTKLPIEPNIGITVPIEFQYYSLDSPAKWNKNVDRDYITEKISYKFNKQGYRSENNFDDNYDYGFLIAGDSFVLGEGIPVKETWAYQLTKKISNELNIDLPHLSLGWPGASSTRIIQNIMTFINSYKTNRVLAMFPTHTRMSYYGGYGDFFDDTQTNDTKYSRLYRIINEESFFNFFVKDLYLVQTFCKLKKIPFNWISWEDKVNVSVKLMPRELQSTFIPFDIKDHFPMNVPINRARDGHHPGKAFQQAITNLIFDYYSFSIENGRF